jgi:ABC-2 type transport system ATP-binding protein
VSEDPAPVRAAIDAHGLTRRFGAHVAVDRLDLSIPARTTFGLLGPNGAGKTTFIRMVTGYLLPSAGRISVEGLSPILDPVAVRRRLGFVMETSCLYPELRVLGFLEFLGGVRGLSGAQLRRAVEDSIERFHLTAVTQRRIGNLSKGFQQRVSLAQAFLHDPSLVIVDEPTLGLDPVQQAEVQELLARLRGERTVLLSTHDLQEARRLAEHVAVLNRGRLAAQGPTESVLGGGDALALFRDPLPEGG